MTDTHTPAESWHEAPADSLPAPTYLSLPFDLVQGAILNAGDDDGRPYTTGIYIHRAGTDVRIAATNGHRLYVASCPVPSAPAWLEDGVLLPAAELKPLLALLARRTDGGRFRLGWAPELPKAEIADHVGDTTFRVAVIADSFPPYEPVIANAADAVDGGERAPLDSTAFEAKHLKAAAELQKVIGARGVHALLGGTGSPSLFTFAGRPGVALYIATLVGAGAAIEAATAAILAPGLKATLAALKAHQTRAAQKAEAESDATERQRLEARAAEFADRIAAIITGAGLTLPAPEGEAAVAETAPKPGKAKRPAKAKGPAKGKTAAKAKAPKAPPARRSKRAPEAEARA
jgi:hypothetical protein